AITSALRLSAVYKVSVVLIAPQPAPALARQVQVYSVSASPTTLPLGSAGQVIGTLRTVRYAAPPDAAPQQRSFDLSPATAGPSETFLLLGGGLDQPTAAQVFLLAGGDEYDITHWIAAMSNPSPPPPAVPARSDAKITLQLPTTFGVLPPSGQVPTDTPRA